MQIFAFCGLSRRSPSQVARQNRAKRSCGGFLCRTSFSHSQNGLPPSIPVRVTGGFLESSSGRLHLCELSFQLVRGHFESLSQPGQVRFQVFAVQLSRFLGIWQVKDFKGCEQMPARKFMGDHFFCKSRPLLQDRQIQKSRPVNP